MSTFTMRVLGRGGTIALAILVVVGVVAVTLLASAIAGETTGPSGSSPAQGQGAVTDAGVNPWEANDPALLPLLGGTGR